MYFSEEIKVHNVLLSMVKVVKIIPITTPGLFLRCIGNKIELDT